MATRRACLDTLLGFDLGLIRVAGLGGGGARLDMAICTLLVTMASPGCARCHPTRLHKHSRRRSWGESLSLDVGGSTRIAFAAMLSQGGGGWTSLEPPFLIAVLRYPFLSLVG